MNAVTAIMIMIAIQRFPKTQWQYRSELNQSQWLCTKSSIRLLRLFTGTQTFRANIVELSPDHMNTSYPNDNKNKTEESRYSRAFDCKVLTILIREHDNKPTRVRTLSYMGHVSADSKLNLGMSTRDHTLSSQLPHWNYHLFISGLLVVV